jgi:hypothetical protein
MMNQTIIGVIPHLDLVYHLPDEFLIALLRAKVPIAQGVERHARPRKSFMEKFHYLHKRSGGTIAYPQRTALSASTIFTW